MSRREGASIRPTCSRSSLGEVCPLLLVRPFAGDLVQQGNELATVGYRELLELEGEVLLLHHGGVRIQGGVVSELQEDGPLGDDPHE
jgi:hypothetical protein